MRPMMRSIMSRYRADEATIVLIDPRRKSVGVVPEEWLSRYTYAVGDIKQVVGSLCELLKSAFPHRRPLSTRCCKFWESREIFIVVDDATVWPSATTRWRTWRPTSSRPTSLGCTSSPPPKSATGASSPRGLGAAGW